ncbi:MAG TPA: hypothetical protein VHE30_16990 [Polyangiaceae bacterium]|nr:hypothetical protein [Polyangiaceae bacterium]
MSRFRFLVAATLSALCPGCAGSDARQAAPDAGADAGFVDAGPPVCKLNDAPDLGPGADGGEPCGDVVNRIIRETCVGGICHHAGKVQAAQMNLLSPCVADRIVGTPATCSGRLIVDPEDPERSFMLEKLTTDTPECGGESMPYDNHLDRADLSCMKAWIRAIAAEARSGG